MTIVYNALLVLHFVGLAMLLGGFIVQVRDPMKTVTRWMWDGALTQFVTGIFMVAMLSRGMIEGESPNNTIVGVKTVISVIVLFIAFFGRRRPAPQVGLWAAAGGLTIFNVLIAVFVGVIAS